ncbi:unnamed protein product [Caenorhabditis bovis]|uniref:CDT1 Geminin-binding domain-containing protein n=1 Tax=Caenorhabditis bovis TaxID=2654633 RepID=A0A8S1F4M9_9PELO|nr:unnamed protein product [Caenorhabditis bovis]
MSTRSTRSKTNEAAQTLVKDYFKETRKGRTRSEKKVIEEPPVKQETRQTRSKKVVKVEEAPQTEVEAQPTRIEAPPAPLFEKKTRSRTRTPSRQLPAELTGTPPKKQRDDETPAIAASSKSAIDELIEAAAPTTTAKKPTKIRTVADLQARLAEKGATTRAIHAQNLKHKAKRVDEHAELLKSPTKNAAVGETSAVSPAKRRLAPVPDYIMPGYQAQKSAEKMRDELDVEHENEIQRRAADILKVSRLSDEVKESLKSGIELPRSYEHIYSAFQHVDRIVSIITNQNRTCVANELFKNVKNTMQKDFSTRHLSQLLHVYPQSYNVEMRQQWKAFGGAQTGKYELTVMPNLVDDLKGFVKDESPATATDLPLVRSGKLMASPMKSPRKGGPAQPALRRPEIDVRTRLDAARMRDRAHVFKHKLIEIVKTHYEAFLEKQGLKLSSTHKRLHPLFRVEEHCPPLEQKALPEPPIVKNNRHIGMREYVEENSADVEIQLPSMVQKAIDGLKSPMKKVDGGSSIPLSPKKFAELKNEQKSKGAMTLLERIRAKEACRKAAENCVDEKVKLRKSRLTMLDTRYLRTICSLFASKKARSMEMDVVAEKLVFSAQIPTSKPEVIAHLEFLCQIAPNYAIEANVMGKRYFQLIDNNYEELSEIVREQLASAEKAANEQRARIEEAQKAALSMASDSMSAKFASRPFSPQLNKSKATRALKFA